MITVEIPTVEGPIVTASAWSVSRNFVVHPPLEGNPYRGPLVLTHKRSGHMLADGIRSLADGKLLAGELEPLFAWGRVRGPTSPLLDVHNKAIRVVIKRYETLSEVAP